jgi:hypothetical protein
MSKIIKNGEYNDLIYALKSQIQSAQIKAAVSVNRELLQLYRINSRFLTENPFISGNSCCKSWLTCFINPSPQRGTSPYFSNSLGTKPADYQQSKLNQRSLVLCAKNHRQ